MADNSVTCSMSRPGNVWGNAARESFLSSLKTEQTVRKTYRAEIRQSPRRSNNRTLLQSHTQTLDLGYLSPINFERQANVT